MFAAKETREAVMFSVIRIVILIACAYAGSAIAEMQMTSPNAVSASQP